MSRITNQIAKDVAIAMLKEKKQQFLLIEKSLADLALTEFVQRLPKGLYEMFKKHKSYFSYSQSVTLKGVGLDHEHVSLSEQIPYGNTTTVILPDDVAAKASKLVNKLCDDKKAYIKLLKEIEIALINIRTYKNCLAIFPEAVPFLPKTTVSTAVAVNIGSIRGALFATAV